MERDRALDAWLAGLSPTAPPAILLGIGSTNDLSVLRSFARRSVPTLHLVSQRLLGSFSRFGCRVRMPAVEHEPEVWLAALARVGVALRTPATVLALTDEHCELLSRNAERLRGGSLRFVVPDAETFGRIVDKRLQYTAAEAAGARIPPTFYPEDVGAVTALAPVLSYPVILKPYTSYVGRPRIGNRKVVVVASPDELITAFGRCAATGARFMVQQIVAGGDDAIFWYSGFWDADGRERAWFTVQKLRQFPTGFGDGCLQRTVDVPEIVDESRRLLAAFRYRGLVMVEFKRDPIDGAYVLMEINPRTVSGNQLGITAGVDLAWIAHRHLTADDVRPDETAAPDGRIGVQYVNEEWDTLAFLEARAAGRLGLRAWLRSLRGTRAWAIFAWNDPGPLLIGIWRMLVRAIRGPAAPPPSATP
jgi:D-aspartate ligase